MFRPIVKQAITLSRQSWNGILLVNKLVKVCPSPTHSRHVNRLLKACAGLAVIVLPFSGLPVVCCNKPCCCAEKKKLPHPPFKQLQRLFGSSLSSDTPLVQVKGLV